MSEFDPWSQDEWWRAQNPGASVARGVLYGIGLSIPLWLALVVVLWMVLN